MKVAVWLGNAAPVRSIRWLDGVLATAAKLGDATAIAAGENTWLDLASDRATRAGMASMGITTDLKLDYIGWAQIVTAAIKKIGAERVLVDEVSRPERAPEVAAIADLLDAVQVTRVVAVVPDGDLLRTIRIAGSELQTLRVRGPAVLGVRIAGPAVDEYPTPVPTKTTARRDLASLGIDPHVLGHRALPPRAMQSQAKKTVEHIGDHLAFHLAPKGS